MSQGSTYESLQKGVVEGTFGPMEVLKGWNQAEVVKYTTNCPDIGYTTSMFIIMNKKKWDNLPKDIQKTMDDVSNEWISVHGNTWNDVDIKGKEYTMSRGNNIIQLSDEESKQWKNAVMPVIDNYIAKTNKNGLDGKKYVDLLTELIDKK